MTRPHVLLVDDDADIRETMAYLLDANGWDVATATDGEEALRWLHEHPEPCVIILDLMMPGMNGFEFRQRQLGDPEVANLPTIVLTGAGLRRVEAANEETGAFDEVEVLTKPIGVRTLIDTLERLSSRTPDRTPS